MLAAIAGAFGTDHAWRNPGSIDHELLLTATLEGYKPKGSRLNAVAANGKQAMVLVYGGFDTGKGIRDFIAGLDFNRNLPRLVANDDMVFEKNSRSEEHTSELQSLMRISYAVF